MKVTREIPRGEVFEGEHRIWVEAAPGDEGEVEGLEMVAGHDEDVAVYRARVTVTPEEADRLKAGEPFWISFVGGVTPFYVGMADRKAEADEVVLVDDGGDAPVGDLGGGVG